MAPVLRHSLFAFAIVLAGSGLAYGEEQKSEASRDANAKPVSEWILGNWEGKISINKDSLKKFMKDQNLPDEALPVIQKRMEMFNMYFSFQKDGTGKAGMARNGRLSFDDTKWKVEIEKGNHAVIAIIDHEDENGKLDAIFQEDGTIIAKVIPPKKQQGRIPDMTLTLKKIKKLPEETEPMPKKETPKPE